MTAHKCPEKKVKMGRPTLYCEEIAELICQRVATSTVGLAKLCVLHDDLPDRTTINLWRYKHSDFSSRYARAKLFQADLLAEECLDIADNDSNDTIFDDDGNALCNTEFIARSRLRIDTRKWLASKLLPKQYGQHAEEEKADTKTVIEMLIDKLVD